MRRALRCEPASVRRMAAGRDPALSKAVASVSGRACRCSPGGYGISRRPRGIARAFSSRHRSERSSPPSSPPVPTGVRGHPTHPSGPAAHTRSLPRDPGFPGSAPIAATLRPCIPPKHAVWQGETGFLPPAPRHPLAWPASRCPEHLQAQLRRSDHRRGEEDRGSLRRSGSRRREVSGVRFPARVTVGHAAGWCGTQWPPSAAIAASRTSASPPEAVPLKKALRATAETEASRIPESISG